MKIEYRGDMVKLTSKKKIILDSVLSFGSMYKSALFPLSWHPVNLGSFVKL